MIPLGSGVLMRDEQIPAIAPEEMARVDRLLATEFGIDVLQLMEMAGLAVATWARSRFLGGDARGARVLVLAGSGGNGGDALVAARCSLPGARPSSFT